MTPALPILPSLEQSSTLDDPSCDNCKYFREDGRCQKYPPIGGGWAMVDPKDWCGKHEFGERREEPADVAIEIEVEPNDTKPTEAIPSLVR